MGNREAGTTLIVSDTEAAATAESVFGIPGTAQRLMGEFDQNFRVQDRQGRLFVLKFTPPHIGAARVEFQNALLEHLAAQAPHLHVPRLVRTWAGDTVWLDESRGGVFVRLLAWIDGEAYSDRQPKAPALRTSLGVFVAELAGALAPFAYRDPPRGHMWDLACADQHLASSRFITDARTQNLVGRIFERFAAETRPALKDLPGSAIHGDINDGNLLLSDGARGEVTWGLIDFGDAAWSHAVCELAIAATYACIGEARPDLAVADVAGGYADTRVLSAAERRLVMPLVETRLAVSLCVSARRRQERPGEAHLQSSAESAAATLALLTHR